VNRRFGAVVRRNIVPAAASGQDVQDAVEQPAGVASRSADVRLRWREVFLDDCPEIIVNFPEGHDRVFYLKGLIILGQPLSFSWSPNDTRISSRSLQTTSHLANGARYLEISLSVLR
jgi:hypothetical protein